MVTFIEMSNWSNEIEQELTILIKDWLKQTGKTQAELSQNLNATSTRLSDTNFFL